MNNKITLLDVCKLPDVQLHSKTAFFKALLQKENPEITQMRQNIARLSYTIKTIGVQGTEVGITSKRLPLKYKEQIEHQQNNKKNTIILSKGYIPHQSFFAEPLISIRKEIADKPRKQIRGLQIFPIKDEFQMLQPARNYSFKMRSKSMATLRRFDSRKTKENIEQIGKITAPHWQSISDIQKQSYSGLLKECGTQKSKTLTIQPVRHQQNPMYKKIKKIKQQAEKQIATDRPMKISTFYGKYHESLTKNQKSNYRSTGFFQKQLLSKSKNQQF